MLLLIKYRPLKYIYAVSETLLDDKKKAAMQLFYHKFVVISSTCENISATTKKIWSKTFFFIGAL